MFVFIFVQNVEDLMEQSNTSKLTVKNGVVFDKICDG